MGVHPVAGEADNVSRVEEALRTADAARLQPQKISKCMLLVVGGPRQAASEKFSKCRLLVVVGPKDPA
jgi:hypothetical protein